MVTTEPNWDQINKDKQEQIHFGMIYNQTSKFIINQYGTKVIDDDNKPRKDYDVIFDAAFDMFKNTLKRNKERYFNEKDVSKGTVKQSYQGIKIEKSTMTNQGPLNTKDKDDVEKLKETEENKIKPIDDDLKGL